MTGTALVLGGGGYTGIGWEIGMLAGLVEAGVDLGTADVVIGTSAGSIVGAQLTSGRLTPEELFARQLVPDTGRPRRAWARGSWPASPTWRCVRAMRWTSGYGWGASP